MNLPKLLLITDQESTDIEIFARLRRVVTAVGPSMLGVLARGRSKEAIRQVREITSSAGVWLIVHTDVELARSIGADGIHFPASKTDSMSVELAAWFRWRSIAAHSDSELTDGIRRGANAALISPIFATPGKGTPRGEDALGSAQRIAPSVHRIALGGIDKSNVGRCIRAGATGVGVVRAWLESDHPEIATKLLLEAFR